MGDSVWAKHNSPTHWRLGGLSREELEQAALPSPQAGGMEEGQQLPAVMAALRSELGL